jgi:hypothetical protein
MGKKVANRDSERRRAEAGIIPIGFFESASVKSRKEKEAQDGTE